MSKDTWYTKPKIIKYIPRDKFILFVDESGNNSKKAIENSLKNGKRGNSIRDDVYLLNGIIMYGVDHTILTSRFNKIKNKLTKDGTFEYPGKGVRPINFHNVDIENNKAPFNTLYSDFGQDINNVLEKTKFTQISAGINYYCYSTHQNTTEFDSLLISLGIIIYKYAKYLNDQQKDGIVVFETENIVEDEKKLAYVKKILKKGSRKNPASFYSHIKSVYFRPKWAYVNNQWKTCAGIELADLTISPIRRLYHPEFITIENKMYGFPNYGRESINIVR